MQITVNGQTRVVADSMTLAQLVAELQLQPKYIAIERNCQLVPRTQHAQCVLEPDDQLEIVTLVGGG